MASVVIVVGAWLLTVLYRLETSICLLVIPFPAESFKDIVKVVESFKTKEFCPLIVIVVPTTLTTLVALMVPVVAVIVIIRLLLSAPIPNVAVAAPLALVVALVTVTMPDVAEKATV